MKVRNSAAKEFGLFLVAIIAILNIINSIVIMPGALCVIGVVTSVFVIYVDFAMYKFYSGNPKLINKLLKL